MEFNSLADLGWNAQYLAQVSGADAEILSRTLDNGHGGDPATSYLIKVPWVHFEGARSGQKLPWQIVASLRIAPANVTNFIWIVQKPLQGKLLHTNYELTCSSLNSPSSFSPISSNCAVEVFDLWDVSTSISLIDMSPPEVATNTFVEGEIEVVSLALESRRLVLALDLAERRLVFSTRSERFSVIDVESFSGTAST